MRWPFVFRRRNAVEPTARVVVAPMSLTVHTGPLTSHPGVLSLPDVAGTRPLVVPRPNLVDTGAPRGRLVVFPLLRHREPVRRRAGRRGRQVPVVPTSRVERRVLPVIDHTPVEPEPTEPFAPTSYAAEPVAEVGGSWETGDELAELKAILETARRQARTDDASPAHSRPAPEGQAAAPRRLSLGESRRRGISTRRLASEPEPTPPTDLPPTEPGDVEPGDVEPRDAEAAATKIESAEAAGTEIGSAEGGLTKAGGMEARGMDAGGTDGGRTKARGAEARGTEGGVEEAASAQVWPAQGPRARARLGEVAPVVSVPAELPIATASPAQGSPSQGLPARARLAEAASVARVRAELPIATASPDQIRPAAQPAAVKPAGISGFGADVSEPDAVLVDGIGPAPVADPSTVVEPSWLVAEPAPPDVAAREQAPTWPVSVEPMPIESAGAAPEASAVRPRRLGLGAPLNRPQATQKQPPAGPDVVSRAQQSQHEQVRREPVPVELARVVGVTQGVDVSETPVFRGTGVTDRARALGAHAFTSAGEVYLPDETGPLTGREAGALLVHELTHVAQQQVLGADLPAESTSAGQALEHEALATERWFRNGVTGPPLIHPPVAGVLAVRPSRQTSPDLVQRRADGGMSWTAPQEALDFFGTPAASSTPEPAAVDSPPFDPPSGSTWSGPTPTQSPTGGGFAELEEFLDTRAEVSEPPKERQPEPPVDRELAACRDRLVELCTQRPVNLDSALDLDELATKVYQRVRGLLRRELIVDRERSGLLVDFR